MTGTAVKNATAVLANVSPNTGKNTKSMAAMPGDFDFQSVWNNQMEKSEQNAVNTQNSAVGAEKREKPDANRDDVKPQATEQNLKSPTDGQQSAGTDRVSQERPEQTEELAPEELNPKELNPKELKPEELSPEELEAVMEVLGAAAMELMQEIADTFGISTEELQGILDELGMKPLNLLQPAGLGEVVLKIGGAEDSLALLTDETLCDNYKALMERMTEVLNETAEDLKTEPKQLEVLLDERPETVEEQADFEEKVFAGAVSEKGSDRPKEIELRGNVGTKALNPLMEDNRPQIENSVDRTDGAEDKKSGEKQSGKEPDGGQQGNLFAQEFKTLQPETGLQQTQSAAQSASWNADTQDIMRQIMDYMKLQLNADTTNLEMHLHPESLGTLHIQVEAKAGVITASFIAQNEAVKAALESQIVQLKENFEEQGVKVEAIEVMVQSHAFERNLEQGREQNQGSNEPSKKARVRRINLNDLSAMDDMEEEDVLAADMLAAGGSTVDYTA